MRVGSLILAALPFIVLLLALACGGYLLVRWLARDIRDLRYDLRRRQGDCGRCARPLGTQNAVTCPACGEQNLPAIYARWETRVRLPPVCIYCGYDLGGLDAGKAGRCPECGHPRVCRACGHVFDRVQDRRCAKCGSSLQVQRERPE